MITGLINSLTVNILYIEIQVVVTDLLIYYKEINIKCCIHNSNFNLKQTFCIYL